MNELDRQLQRAFTTARSARRARIHADPMAPIGFATRVVARWQTVAEHDHAAAGWRSLAGWGLGLACGVMLLSLVLNWGRLNVEWSPALVLADQVTELVSLP